jgi:hypothetical protein
MQAWRSLMMGLFVLLPLTFTLQALPAQRWAGEQRNFVSPAEALAPSVTLRAASGKTIEFRTQNGGTVQGNPPQTRAIPHLVLSRNGTLADPAERTLAVTVSNVPVPPAGVTVTLTIETQHGEPAQDPDLAGEPGARIMVWRESKRLVSSLGSIPETMSATFAPQFGGTVRTGSATIPTPTDYFRYELLILAAEHPSSDPLYVFGQDAAFLMEHESTVPLGPEHGVGGGAGPEWLTIYYCDMVPFQRNLHDAATRLRREEIPGYVQGELVPAMLEALHVETQEWGFAWSPAWTSWRDGDPSRLSVSLSDGETWYHGPAPQGGLSSIAIRVNGGDNADYDTLTEGIMNLFYHELFHNLQRSMAQELAGHGDVAGRADAWRFFSEGTAVLASSVGQPAVQFGQSRTGRPRAYLSSAQKYMGGSGYAGDLNASYAEMTPYHGAMYWRFLYEQCGGPDDPRTGMALVRRALAVLYSRKVVDIGSTIDRAGSTDLVSHVPAIMDEVLASPEAASCPWRTYQDSLVHFSRAVYGLRLEGGRCVAAGLPAGCSFYDPQGFYNAPAVSEVVYRGQALTFDAAAQLCPPGIRSSYGIDLIEVVLRDETGGQPLTLDFSGDPAGRALFSVQIWKLMDDGTGSSWQPRLTAVSPPEALVQEVAGGHLLYTIPEIDTSVYNRLGVIITRLDGQEDLDAAGAYTLALYAPK